MGRLPALALLALAACPSGASTSGDPPPSRRSDMVVADPVKTAPPDAAGHPAAAADAGHAEAPAPHRTGPLCATLDIPVTEPVPPPPGSVLSAPGAPPPAAIDPAGTRWTWINLWAAWCVPCREEMPLLRSWLPRLQGDGISVDLGLVSLDDDERQLRQFLERATGALPRSSLWSPGGTARTRWLRSVGLRDSPGLPVQVLVRPGGELACTIQGAVEPSDYSAVRDVMKRP